MARPAPLARAPKDAALQLLKADHEEVKVLFDEFEDTDEPRERDVVVRRLRGLLTVHARIEEELFYPALREAFDAEDRPLLEEAAVEHESARELIVKLEGAPAADDGRYAALVKVLGEYVRHHVDEEEDEIFPRARAANLDQASLAAALLERKQTLMSELGLEDDDDEEDEDDDEDFDEDDFEDDEDEDEDEDEDWDEDDDEEEIEEEDEDEALGDDDDEEEEDEDEDEETDAAEDAPAPARRRSGR